MSLQAKGSNPKCPTGKAGSGIPITSSVKRSSCIYMTIFVSVCRKAIIFFRSEWITLEVQCSSAVSLVHLLLP